MSSLWWIVGSPGASYGEMGVKNFKYGVPFEEYCKVRYRIASPILGYPSSEAAYDSVEEWELDNPGMSWRVVLKASADLYTGGRNENG